MTLDESISTFLQHIRDERAFSGRTVEGYAQELQLFARVVDGTRQVQSIAREDLIVFLGRPTPRGRPLNPASRNHKLAVLRSYFNYITYAKISTVNPTLDIQWVRVPQSERLCITMDDYQKLLLLLEQRAPSWLSVRDRATIQLFLHTGIRVSELARLSIHQVDLERSVLSGLVRKGGAERTIPLNRVAAAELASWLNQRAARDVRSDKVFIGRTGDALGRRQIERRVKKLSSDAGIGITVTPHVLRHLHASELASRGTNMEVISQSMNHRSIITTSRYCHVGLVEVRAAVDRLAEERG